MQRRSGKTVAHVAAEFGSVETTKLLIDLELKEWKFRANQVDLERNPDQKHLQLSELLDSDLPRSMFRKKDGINKSPVRHAGMLRHGDSHCYHATRFRKKRAASLEPASPRGDRCFHCSVLPFANALANYPITTVLMGTVALPSIADLLGGIAGPFRRGGNAGHVPVHGASADICPIRAASQSPVVPMTAPLLPPYVLLTSQHYFISIAYCTLLPFRYRHCCVVLQHWRAKTNTIRRNAH